MILSVSRRSDIPNYYADWFFNRLRAGYCLVRNPFNAAQVSRIDLSPAVVDAIVFWTKNPAPMLPRLAALSDYPYYFQFTLTPYGPEVEPGLPGKQTALCDTFIRLAKEIGPQRVVWRYDPIFLNARYTYAYHLAAFARLAGRLEGSTDRVVISFLDQYDKIQGRMRPLKVSAVTDTRKQELAGQLARLAAEHGMVMQSCAAALDFTSAGIEPGSCIDRTRLETLIGCSLAVKKDANQRPECRCAASIDIGTYNTCPNLCHYCYANMSEKTVQTRRQRYRADSPLLCDELKETDQIHVRDVRSDKEPQLRLDLSAGQKQRPIK